MQHQSDIVNALHAVWDGICRHNFSVTETIEQYTLRIEVVVFNDDFRILRGRDGRNEHATKRLLDWACRRNQCNGEYKLTNNHRGEIIQIHEFRNDPEFKTEKLKSVLWPLCVAVGLSTGGIKLDEAGQNGKLNVRIPVKDVRERAIVSDLNDVMYPWGFTQGRKIDIKPID